MEAVVSFDVESLSPVRMSFVHGKLIVSRSFLQHKLGKNRTLVSLCAVIGSCLDMHSKIELASHKDFEGNVQYIMEESLASKYVVISKFRDTDVRSVSSTRTLEKGSDRTPHSINIDSSESSDPLEFKEHTEISPPKSEKNSKTPFIDIDDDIDDQIDNVFCSANHPLAPTHANTKFGRSIVEHILSKQGTSLLKKLLVKVSRHYTVEELPRQYDGDMLFEFPPTFARTSGMSGMEHRYDGHMWTKPTTTNVLFDGIVRISYCVGILECQRVTCPQYVNCGKRNRTFFKGSLKKKCDMGLVAEGVGNIQCTFCQKPAICVGACSCIVYYVMPRDTSLTRLMIHIGTHTHNVQPGTSKERIERTRDLVDKVVAADKSAAPRKVQMNIAKELIKSSMLKSDRKKGDTVGDVELTNILEELVPLVENRRLRRMVSNARGANLAQGDAVDNLLMLKKNSLYDFFHGSRFPGQGMPDDRCYIFKMSTQGPASGVDLVNRMRRSSNGDLRAAWVQFDHTRRVLGWTTMACHVYDPSIQELLTIATCEMKEEDTVSQILFWDLLNSIMERSGHAKADFRGFMADEAQANWRAIRTVFNGGPDNEMIGQERSCLFHWAQSLHIHTTKFVQKDYQMEHKNLCEQWRSCGSRDEALAQCRLIRQWWRTGKVRDSDIPSMDSWMSWWNIRIPHWGEYMVAVLDGVEGANTPRTNLSESKHGSWLAGEGHKSVISLYDACVSDMANALLQSAKQHAYTLGRHLGEGPSLENLINRSASRNQTRPREVLRTVNQAVTGTPMHRQPSALAGDRETVRRKRRPSVVVEIEDNGSHRPEFNFENVDRRHKGRPRKINFCPGTQDVLAKSTHPTEMTCFVNGEVVVERYVHNVFWAIRRTSINSRVKCLGWIPNTGKCGRMISNSSKGTPAPCFYGARKHPNGKTQQMMWFCNNDCTHSWEPERSISPKPVRIPNVWPIAKGTNLTQQEVDMLVHAGFQLETKPVNVGQGSRIHTGQDEVQVNVASSSAIGRDGRRFKFRTGISAAALLRIKKALTMNAEVVQVKVVEQGIHEVFVVKTGSLADPNTQYDVHVARDPLCTCPDFQKRYVDGKPYLACKHLYYVFLRVMGLDQNNNMFVHQPILKDVEVFRALTQNRTFS